MDTVIANSQRGCGIGKMLSWYKDVQNVLRKYVRQHETLDAFMLFKPIHDGSIQMLQQKLSLVRPGDGFLVCFPVVMNGSCNFLFLIDWSGTQCVRLLL